MFLTATIPDLDGGSYFGAHQSEGFPLHFLSVGVLYIKNFSSHTVLKVLVSQ